MKRVLLPVLLCWVYGVVSAQTYISKTSQAGFYSHTWLEDIAAVNKQVMAVIDLSQKNIAFSMLMKEFVFEKKLMQEHFNENYVESDKYPKSTFTGTYTGEVDITKDGTYPITVKGKISLHGVTRDLQAPATLTVKDGMLTGTTSFKLNPKDFNISIPFVVRDKIEKENTVKVQASWTLK
ncbi:MAG: YceI family protein [Candidatus Pseudobacter hemicellulosilyticus]|uniref:YceI family protein n=1 Tax=Candidatus Pseudobacter hemicellulosilyticus TaxID=3121375 RepID=A0AAJ5WRF3_9BACT|nr:MAG: YceI family protein [Pseudobacter sp.]